MRTTKNLPPAMAFLLCIMSASGQRSVIDKKACDTAPMGAQVQTFRGYEIDVIAPGNKPFKAARGIGRYSKGDRG